MANGQSFPEEFNSLWKETALLEATFPPFDDTQTNLPMRHSVEKPSVPFLGLEVDLLQTKTTREPVPRRMRTSNACTECKWRRRKCTGDSPCHTCTILSVQCFYDPSSDRRSRAYSQKKTIDGTKESMRSCFNVLRPDEHPPQDAQLSEEQDARNVLGVGSHVNSSSVITEYVPLLREQSLSPMNPISDNLTSSDAPGRTLSPLISPLLCDLLICTSNCTLLSSTSHAQWYSQCLLSKQLVLLRQPVHQIPAHQIPDASPLSHSYTNFVSAAEQVSQSGLPLCSLLGDIDPEVDLLFRPQKSSDLLTSATWACEITKKFMPFDIYTQLAYVFLVFRLMRWTLSPTFEHWILLPPIMRPTTLQRCVPHYPSADMQPLPVMREALIRGECTLHAPVGNIQRAGTQRIKMYWPFGMDAALNHDPVTGETVPSRLFTEAAADESNWSCGIDVLKELSEVGQGVYNMVVHMHGWDEART